MNSYSLEFSRSVATRQAFRPVYVKVKLIFGCNLACEMCNHWRQARADALPMTRWYEIVDELAGLGCRKLHLSGGEPLLRPNVPDLIARATGQGIRVTMTTNGTLLTKELARELVLAGLRGINISIESPDRKIHDRLRGRRGAWKKAVRAVEYMRRYAHKGKLRIGVNTVVSRGNYASLSGLPDLVHDIGADCLNLIPVDDHCGEQLALRFRDIRDYNSEIAPQLASRSMELGLIPHSGAAFPFGQTVCEIKQARHGEYAFGWYRTHPCFAPWTHSLIDYNGLVYVCCMTREQIEPLGDLRQTSFREIWTGLPYQAIRRRMHPPTLAPCRRCDDFVEENRRLEETILSLPVAKQSSEPS